VKRVKRFVDVRLRCIVSNLKRISKIVDSAPLEKLLQTLVIDVQHAAEKEQHRCQAT